MLAARNILHYPRVRNNTAELPLEASDATNPSAMNTVDCCYYLVDVTVIILQYCINVSKIDGK